MKYYIITRPGGLIHKYRVLATGEVQNMWRTEWTTANYTEEELLEEGAVLTDQFCQAVLN